MLGWNTLDASCRVSKARQHKALRGSRDVFADFVCKLIPMTLRLYDVSLAKGQPKEAVGRMRPLRHQFQLYWHVETQKLEECRHRPPCFTVVNGSVAKVPRNYHNVGISGPSARACRLLPEVLNAALHGLAGRWRTLLELWRGARSRRQGETAGVPGHMTEGRVECRKPRIWNPHKLTWTQEAWVCNGVAVGQLVHWTAWPRYRTQDPCCYYEDYESMNHTHCITPL